jgi:alpha-beta hydrolase superfamily lysophospholipase
VAAPGGAAPVAKEAQVKSRDLQFPGMRETTLHAQAWLPEGEPRAVVVISHGLAEHGGRYGALAERLVAGHYAVYALDHRGHGRSPGGRANIERFAYVVSDLGTFVGRAQRQHPGHPAFLIGHSMGGAIALGCALQYPAALKGLVLSAPALSAGDEVPFLKSWLVRLLSAVAPGVGALTLPASAISRDPAVVSAYEQDPLVHRGSIPARTLAELLGAMKDFPARAGQLRIPVLVQHGTADSLVPYEGNRTIYAALGQPKLRVIRTYNGLFHEIYNEPERDRVIADLEAWLEIHA